MDESAANELKKLVSTARQLKKLDLSYSRVTNFSAFIDILQAIVQSNKSIQYLNIGGISYNDLQLVTEPKSI